jgi:hypothetical protein
MGHSANRQGRSDAVAAYCGGLPLWRDGKAPPQLQQWTGRAKALTEFSVRVWDCTLDKGPYFRSMVSV